MELLSKLVHTALVACYECAVIDWLPDDDAPPAFCAECEIEQNPWNGDFFVTLAGVLLFVESREISKETMDYWHASLLSEWWGCERKEQ